MFSLDVFRDYQQVTNQGASSVSDGTPLKVETFSRLIVSQSLAESFQLIKSENRN